MPADSPLSKGEDQKLSDLDQTAADADQISADLDQTASDTDQGASDIDQVASERDQRAADLDQADSDRARASGASAPNWARTRRTRAQTTIERDAAAHSRSETARVRDATADERDRLADARDAAANARDQLAVVLDAEIEQLEKTRRQGANGSHAGLDALLDAGNDRKRAAAFRDRAAVARQDAARDRKLAHQDRAAATADRQASAEELALEGTDHLTETMRRRVGLAAIQREFERTHRSREPLVIAFVDVDGLKQVNDEHGHAAGDALLLGVAQCIKVALRPYDLIMRYGGDEFVCSLSGQDLAGVRDRFADIAARIATRKDGSSISVGLAEREADESVNDLIARADQAMMSTRNGQAVARA